MIVVVVHAVVEEAHHRDEEDQVLVGRREDDHLPVAVQRESDRDQRVRHQIINAKKLINFVIERNMIRAENICIFISIYLYIDII